MVGMKANLSFWSGKSALRVLIEHRGGLSSTLETLLRAVFPAAYLSVETTGGMSGDTTRYTLWLPCTLDSLHPVVVSAVRALRDVGIGAELSP